MEIRCAPCILQRGYSEIQEATRDGALQLKAMVSLLSFLSEEFKPTANPAYLGTKRDRLIRKVTGNPDPYGKRKKASNQQALRVVPLAEQLVLNEPSREEKFRKACLCSIVGNVMEFDIPDNPFKVRDLKKLIANAEKDLAIDDISHIFNKAGEAKRILYLTDNAGEIVFDKLLVRELQKARARVTVVVKATPILNDATMEDAKYVGMHKVADDLITTGADAVGLSPTEVSTEFLDHYNSADLVVAKGMGYAETIPELRIRSPHALLLRTKCGPVAHFFGVPMGKNVAKLMS